MSVSRADRRALFAVLFLLSGAAGLVYEQLWIRELQHFFGSTIHSITTVVAAYMGGLGLGAWVMGRRADRHANPAFLYGILELAIGVFGIASPLIFKGVGAAYMVLARGVEPSLWVATAIKFGFAFAVMLVPTFLMGGTLPILTRAFTGPRAESLRRELALFYGLNTVGGVAGCLLGGFVLVEHVGMLRSLLATGALNLALGAAAIALTRRVTADEAMTTTDETSTSEFAAAPPVPDDEPALRKVAIWAIGLTAFASLLYEIAWTRVLVLVVGSSTYAFTTILSCFLLGIGLGSLVATGKGRSSRDLLKTVAIVQGIIAVAAALLFPFFRFLPVYIVGTLQIGFLTPSEQLVLHSLVLAAVIIPPAFGMGLAFPLLAEAAANRGGGSGEETGRAYFANTIGSILGSIVTGFLLIHTIGSERTLELGILVNAVLATWIAWQLAKARGGAAAFLGEGERVGPLLAVLAIVVAFLTPSWSTRLLDRGPAIYGHDRMNRTELRNFLRAYGAEQLSYDEGWNATISVWRNGGTTWLKSNGKADASSVADMNTQVLVGLLPVLAHPRPRSVFIVGLGSGASARAVADAQGVERVDVVEIERAVVDAVRHFDSVNQDILHDPRVRLIEDDARSALQMAAEPYDVIVSEPSNPWIAGIAALFTREYFTVARNHLADDGIFAQWVQMYRVPRAVVAVVIGNLRSVFPYVEVWYSNPSDLVLLAANRPIRWPGARVEAHFDPATPTGRTLRNWVNVTRPSELLGHFLLGDSGTAILARQAAFTHTDDRPTLEFVAARGLLAGGGAATVFDTLLSIKRAAGDSLPILDGGWRLGPGDWQAAYAAALPATERLSLALAESALTADPASADRHALVGRVLFHRDQFRASLPHFDEALRRNPNHADALLLGGIAASAIGDLPRGRALLERAVTAGGDSAHALSVLAETAVGMGEWARAAELTLRAVHALRPTLLTPFPGALQTAMVRLAWEGPPELAAPVFEAARSARPSWDIAYHGGATLFLRWGADHCADAAEVASELPRFGWTDTEVVALLRNCMAR